MSMLTKGTMIGRYRLDAPVGSSNIIEIFRAFDVKLERPVILKIVTHSRGYSNTFTDYFLKEARALAQLSHPSIAKVLDFGRDEGYLYLVMENVSGVPLADQLGKKLDWRSAIELLLPVANALAYAHNNNVIHRDLKPENITINVEGQPVLSDFGIARIIEDEETRDVTGTNAGLGTPAYMSPEQGKGMPVDFRADIYALGIIFFELITGQPPFAAENSMEVLIQQVMTPPPSPTKLVPDLPSSVEQVILTALKKDPDERFQSMEEFIDAMQELRKGRAFRRIPRKKTARRKRPAWALALMAVLVFAAAGWIAETHFNRPAPTVLGAESITVTPTASTTPTPSPSQTTTPTHTQEPTPTAVPHTPTTLPLAMQREFATYPLFEQKPLTQLNTIINPQTAKDMVEVRRFGFHPASQAVWSGDDSSIITATSNSLYFYRPENLKTVQGFFPTSGWATCMALASDDSLAAVGDAAGNIYIIDSMTGEELLILKGHEKRITSLAFSADGLHLVSGSEDRTARVWNLQSVSEVITLRKHSMAVNTVAFSNNGNWVISGSDDFHVIFWNAATGEIVDDRSYGKRVTSIALTRDDSTIAIGLSDTTTQLWNIEGKRLLRTLKDAGQTTQISTVSFSPNGSLLVTGAEDGIARIWNVISGDKIQEFQAVERGSRALQKDDAVSSAHFSNDGTQLLTLTRSSLLRVWSMNSRVMVSETTTGTRKPTRVEFSTGSEAILVGLGDKVVQIWKVQDASVTMTIDGVIPGGLPVSPNNRMFVILRGDVFEVYQFNNSKPVHTLYGFPLSARVSFLPDNKILAAAAARSVYLWTTSTGYQISPETYKYEGNCQVAYTKDGDFLAAGAGFGPNTNPELYGVLCEAVRSVRMVFSLSRDGQYLVQGTDNGAVEITHAAETLQTATLKDVLPGKVLAVAISPDNSLAAAGGEDGSFVLIDMVTGIILRAYDHHTGPIRDLAFSPDGTMLATCSDDGSVQIWGIPE